MVLPSLVRKTWRDDRRAILGWTLGIAAIVTFYSSFYGQFSSVAKLKDDSLSPGIRDFLGLHTLTTPAGYLEGTAYGLVGPILIVMCAITLAARSIARPEEEGGMELLLANPISRRRFAAQRLAAMAGAVTLVAAVPWLVVSIAAPASGMHIAQANINATSIGLILLAWTFGAIAYAVGAATGRRGPVLAVAGTLAVLTFILRATGALVPDLRWIRWLSPFHWYLGSDPLRTGLDPGYLVLPLIVAVVGSVVGILAFDRRDVGV